MGRKSHLNLLEKFKENLNKKIFVNKLILFGSRAWGKPQRYSDFDLIVVSKDFENKNFKKVLADYQHYSFKEQISLIIQLIKLKPDLVHFPHFNVPVLYFGKFVVTIHDLLIHKQKGFILKYDKNVRN